VKSSAVRSAPEPLFYFRIAYVGDPADKKLANVHAIKPAGFCASKRIYDILEEEVKVQDKPGALEVKDFKESIKLIMYFFVIKKSAAF